MWDAALVMEKIQIRSADDNFGDPCYTKSYFNSTVGVSRYEFFIYSMGEKNFIATCTKSNSLNKVQPHVI